MYAKVFAQIYDGTLCTKGPWQALVTFQQMLVLADQCGIVDMTAAAISRRTTIPLEVIEIGLKALLEPDFESRTPTEGGRRIVPLSDRRSWGWRIVNYEHYRKIKREEDRREYHRDYWHKRKLNSSTETQLPQLPQPNQPIAEAEAYTEAKKKRVEARATRFALKTLPDEWAEFCKAERQDLDPESTFSRFSDYWTAQGGQKGRKTDWLATWRNWVRNERGGAVKRSTADVAAEAARIYEERYAQR